MVKRRTMLVNIGLVGGTIALAGCSEQDDEEEESQESDDEPETVETETSGPEQISMDSVQFLYGFSSGLTARMQLRYQAESGSQRTRIEIEAYAGETLIDSDSVWEDLGAGLSTEVELTIEEIGPLEDNDIDDLTEFVIIGRREGEDDAEIASFSGEEVRARAEDE